MSGLFAFLASVFGKGVGGYAALLVFSLATITGSMYVLASREADLAISASVRFEGKEIGTQNQADFKPELSVRTVIVQFEGGIATGVRDAVTNLAGAIRAVSSNIITEAQREDALRAAALASRPSAFGLSADSQLAASASGLSAAAVSSLTQGLQPTAAPPAAPTTAPQGTGSQAAPGPTSPPAVPTQAPVPTQLTQAVVPTPVPVAPTTEATQPAAPTLTPTPVPTPVATVGQDPQPPAATTGPSAPQATSVPVAATVEAAATQVIATAVAAPTTVLATAVPVATLVPTRVPAIGTLTPASFSLQAGTGFAAIFSFSGSLPGGQPVSRDVFLTNGSTTYDFELHLSSSGGSGPLWTDSVNGLQARITMNGAQMYSGPLNFTDVPLGTLFRNETNPRVMNITITLPEAVPNDYQASTFTVTFSFKLTEYVPPP